METLDAAAAEEGVELPEDEGLDLRDYAKLAVFALLAGALIFLLLGFARYFWVKQYGG
jgi:hypothetical protein